MAEICLITSLLNTTYFSHIVIKNKKNAKHFVSSVNVCILAKKLMLVGLALGKDEEEKHSAVVYAQW